MFVDARRMFAPFIFGQAQADRDFARRARRLADTQTDSAEKARLRRYAEELDAQAERRERDGRPLVIAPPANEFSAAD